MEFYYVLIHQQSNNDWTWILASSLQEMRPVSLPIMVSSSSFSVEAEWALIEGTKCSALQNTRGCSSFSKFINPQRITQHWQLVHVSFSIFINMEWIYKSAMHNPEQIYKFTMDL